MLESSSVEFVRPNNVKRGPVLSQRAALNMK
jgi:hypothetical protein